MSTCHARPTGIGAAVGTALLLLIPAAPLIAQVDAGVARIDDLVALGTRAPERMASQSPVPVDVLSRSNLEGTGALETWQQLQRLVPSLNVPHIPIGDNHMRPVTLRGLAPHHVLILVNGKRRHPAPVLLAGPSVAATSFTDLNAIPTSAIERIEVLRDGASAQYGSDAIGGVVNIVLRSDAHSDLQAAAGSVMSTEGGRSFSDGQQVKLGGAYGMTAPGGAHLTLSADFHQRDGTNRAYPDRRPQYFPGDPLNDAPPQVSSYLGNGEMRSTNAFLSAGLPLGGTTQAYAFGGVADRRGDSPDAFFRRPLDMRTVRAVHPDGFLPVVTSAIADLSLDAGIRGVHRHWRWDLGSGWGRSRVAYAVRNSNNVSLGTLSPTQFEAGEVVARQWTSTVDVGRSLRVGHIPVSVAMGAAFRIDWFSTDAGSPDSWRDGGRSIEGGPADGQLAPVGAQGFIGIRPADAVQADRSSVAAYFEADSRPDPRLLLQAALRAERYSDFGSTLDGKVAARIGIMSVLALRGSASSGFRAPSMVEQHFSSSRTVFQQVNGVNTVLTSRTFPVHTPEAQLMGATPLRPEQARNFSAGLVFDMPRMPLITVDVYQVSIGDRIILGGSITDTSIIRLFDDNGMHGIGGGNYFSNAVDTRTRGVDIVASHAFLVHSNGVLRVLAGYNRTRTVVTNVTAPPAPLAAFAAARFNRTSRGILENGQPRETITATLAYQGNRLGMMLHNQRSGPTAQLDRTNPEADQILGAKWVTDARVSYQVHRRMQVALSAANLFDVYPDEWIDFKDGLAATGASMQGIFRHPGALSPFGMNGRTVHVQLEYGWR